MGAAPHAAALGAHTANVLTAWAAVEAHAGRRFSVDVDVSLEAGAFEAEVKRCPRSRHRAAGLPGELLDEARLSLPGRAADACRRRRPNTREPRRIGRRDPDRHPARHRAAGGTRPAAITIATSALPLVEAMEIWRPRPPRRPEPIDAAVPSRGVRPAFGARKPYHVVHFDGQGIHDRTVGLGGLCFEDRRTSASSSSAGILPSSSERARRRCCAITASAASSKPARSRSVRKASESVASLLRSASPSSSP